jgi:hypothetical protein
MVLFHHAMRGRHVRDIDNPAEAIIRSLTQPMYFTRSPEDVYFKMMRESGMADEGGYAHYVLDLAAAEFTESLHPTTRKILRVTPENIRAFAAEMGTIPRKLLRSRIVTRDNVRAALGPNIIGVDATSISFFKVYTDELVIFELPDGAEIVPVSQTYTPI